MLNIRNINVEFHLEITTLKFNRNSRVLFLENMFIFIFS